MQELTLTAEDLASSTPPPALVAWMQRVRHKDADFSEVPGLGVVPVLYEGPNDNEQIDFALGDLVTHGSAAAPGFMDPEGIVVFHSASRTMFKVTIKGDDAPKSVSA